MNQAQLHLYHQTFDQADPYEKVKRLYGFEGSRHLKILDVGSGNGLLGERLRGFGHEVVGLDINLSAGKPWVKAADIAETWPVADGEFDMVICTDVAEHLYDPAYVLKEARRVSRPGSRLIFGVPNHFDLRQRLRVLFGRGIVHWDNLRHGQTAWGYAHIRFFSLGELYQFFSGAGWVVEKAQFNFMGGGIISSRHTPNFIKFFLLRTWPGLFSGKFIFLLDPRVSQGGAQSTKILLTYTPPGL